MKTQHKRIENFLDKLRPPTIRDFWMADKEGEYCMMGFSAREAKEKAMDDWHTYKAPNVKLRGAPLLARPSRTPC